MDVKGFGLDGLGAVHAMTERLCLKNGLFLFNLLYENVRDSFHLFLN